jgi:Transposase DDE domain group 1
MRQVVYGLDRLILFGGGFAMVGVADPPVCRGQRGLLGQCHHRHQSGKRHEIVVIEHAESGVKSCETCTGSAFPNWTDCCVETPIIPAQKALSSYRHPNHGPSRTASGWLSRRLVTTISTKTAAPVIAGMRLRAGRSGSGKGAARMVAQAIATARAAGVNRQVLVRGDCAYGTAAVVAACRRARARFSLVLPKNTAVIAAIAAITAHA